MVHQHRFTVSVLLEIIGKYLVSKYLVLLAINWIKAQNPKTVLIPAQGIGHTIERTMAFLMLRSCSVRCHILPLRAVC